MNYAVIHAFTQLYEVTGNPRYLAMANWIVNQWDMPGAGLYMKLALAGKDMFEFPGNRWESVHDFLGMSDMYLVDRRSEVSPGVHRNLVQHSEGGPPQHRRFHLRRTNHR